MFGSNNPCFKMLALFGRSHMDYEADRIKNGTGELQCDPRP